MRLCYYNVCLSITTNYIAYILFFCCLCKFAHFYSFIETISKRSVVAGLERITAVDRTRRPCTAAQLLWTIIHHAPSLHGIQCASLTLLTNDDGRPATRWGRVDGQVVSGRVTGRRRAVPWTVNIRRKRTEMHAHARLLRLLTAAHKIWLRTRWTGRRRHHAHRTGHPAHCMQRASMWHARWLAGWVTWPATAT